jgi:hypothetical protein
MPFSALLFITFIEFHNCNYSFNFMIFFYIFVNLTPQPHIQGWCEIALRILHGNIICVSYSKLSWNILHKICNMQNGSYWGLLSICDFFAVGNITENNETLSSSAYDVVCISAISLNISPLNRIFVH